jgi:predicted DsbA family dithiol-disulfide isomerase
VQVEIWSDIVCPWCYLGHARFQQALASFGHRDQVQVAYRSFELDPAFPRGASIPVLEMLGRKYGVTRAQAEAAEQRIAGLAAAEGLPLDAGRLHGNTFDAHRLVHFAAERGRQQAVLEALYRAHFGGERSIFDTAAMTAIAAEAGLDPGETRQVLAGDAFGEAVRADQRRARELGVTGVPYFLADARLAVAGGQATEVFAGLLATAWEDGCAAARSGPGAGQGGTPAAGSHPRL